MVLVTLVLCGSGHATEPAEAFRTILPAASAVVEVTVEPAEEAGHMLSMARVFRGHGVPADSALTAVGWEPTVGERWVVLGSVDAEGGLRPLPCTPWSLLRVVGDEAKAADGTVVPRWDLGRILLTAVVVETPWVPATPPPECDVP